MEQNIKPWPKKKLNYLEAIGKALQGSRIITEKLEEEGFFLKVLKDDDGRIYLSKVNLDTDESVLFEPDADFYKESFMVLNRIFFCENNEMVALAYKGKCPKKIKQTIVVRVSKNESGHFFGITTNFPGSVTADGESLEELGRNMRQAIDLTIKVADDLGKGGYEKFKEGFEFGFEFIF